MASVQAPDVEIHMDQLQDDVDTQALRRVAGSGTSRRRRLVVAGLLGVAAVSALVASAVAVLGNGGSASPSSEEPSVGSAQQAAAAVSEELTCEQVEGLFEEPAPRCGDEFRETEGVPVVLERNIIPQVIDDFEFSVGVRVVYPAGPAACGAEYTPDEASVQPEVTFEGAADDTLYTLLMVDPDAPDPNAQIISEIFHWGVKNIPGCDVAQGEFLRNYNGPGPPSGVHRYIFVLFEQPDGPSDAEVGSTSNFSMRDFAQEHNLVPVGGNFIRSQPQRF